MEISAIENDEPKNRHAAFSMFRGDPTFDDFITEIQKYRQQRNQIIEAVLVVGKLMVDTDHPGLKPQG